MFRKLLITALLLMTTPCWAVTQWTLSVPTGAPATTDLKSNFPAEIFAQWSILDTLLSNYVRGMYLSYASSSSITVNPGEAVVSTAGASPRLFLQNTSALTLTSANLDTGASFVAGTTYYVYVGTTSATAATATGYISLSNTAPAGVTYYAQIGSFTTDGSSNITTLVSNNVVSGYVQAVQSKSANTPYQALTDGTLKSFSSGGDNDGAFRGPNGGPVIGLKILSDSSSSPSAILDQCGTTSGTTMIRGSVTAEIKKGDYYEVISNLNTSPDNPSTIVNWTPKGK